MALAHPGLPGHQHPSRGGHPVQARQLGHGGHTLAYDGRVHCAVGPQDKAGEQLGLLLVQQVGPLSPEGGLHRRFHPGLHDDALFAGADGAVVKGLGVQNPFHRLLHVGGVVDIGWAVARPHADGGGSGGVGRLHHGRAAGGQDQPGGVVAHEGVGGLNGGGGNAGDGPRRCPRLLRRPADHIHRLLDAVGRTGMGGEHDGVARLHADHGLVDHRGGGIGGGHQSSHHTHRHADVHRPVLLVFCQDAVGLLVLDGLVQGHRREAVLDLLVLLPAKAGLLHRHIGQPPGVLGPGPGDGCRDGVQLLLSHDGQGPLGLSGLGQQIPDLLDRSQIFIKFHRITPPWDGEPPPSPPRQRRLPPRRRHSGCR